jgi:hypothetical protein
MDWIGAFSGLSPAPNFVITVVDSSSRWFYCSVDEHCVAGMVFALNPAVLCHPNIHPCFRHLKTVYTNVQGSETFAAFQSGAEAFSGTPQTPPEGEIGGTSGPVSSSLASSSSSTTTSSTSASSSEAGSSSTTGTTTTTPGLSQPSETVQASGTSTTVESLSTEPPSFSSSINHTSGGLSAGAIGGIVGGILGGLLLFAVGALCFILGRQRERASHEPGSFGSNTFQANNLNDAPKMEDAGDNYPEVGGRVQDSGLGAEFPVPLNEAD